MKATQVTLNLFPLTKSTFSFLANFSRLSDLKKMHLNLNYLSKLKTHKNPKCAKQSFSFRLLNIPSDLCAWYINAHNNQRCTKIEPTILSLTAGLKQRALIIRLPRQFSIWNTEKYIDRRCNFFDTVKKIMKVLKKLEYWLYTYRSNSMKYKTIM